MLKKISLLGLIFTIILLFSFSFFIVENVYDNTESLIGLTIDGVSTKNFPSKTSGYAIKSILCDKDATGVWDYESWTLKIRNITQSRTKCQINFVNKYTESILNGTDPVLKDELIPVTIENDGTVKKASLGWEWYDYETKHWANAVILNNGTEVYYDGDIIPESNIESYFVWIPRYKYKIWNMGHYETLTTIDYNQTHIIDVVFGDYTTKETEYECAAPNQSGESGNCSIGKYMTHPAFVSFDTFDSTTKGMWVGKFETGYKGANTTSEAEVNENNPNKIQIKPDVYSWRNIQVANAYLTSYNYKRELDSHMMKNMEWGAVAYLQHSAYGSHTSVRINNNSDFKTGYAGVFEPTCNVSKQGEDCNKYGTTDDITKLWNTQIGHLASTTRNASGIYDMSGGSWEYVMGVMLDSANTTPCSGRNATYNSGFNGQYCNTNGSLSDGVSDFPSDTRYYDTYAYATDDKHYNRRILGDATGEMGPFGTDDIGRFLSSWYNDEAWFVESSASWFIRGARYVHGSGAGIFDYEAQSGSFNNLISFRIILTPHEI